MATGSTGHPRPPPLLLADSLFVLHVNERDSTQQTRFDGDRGQIGAHANHNAPHSPSPAPPLTSLPSSCTRFPEPVAVTCDMEVQVSTMLEEQDGAPPE